jgi:hypothetical protein
VNQITQEITDGSGDEHGDPRRGLNLGGERVLTLAIITLCLWEAAAALGEVPFAC